jgi:PadR family transcriptional regulator, regulatory protein PadR
MGRATRLTTTVAGVLRAFLEDVDAPRYGVELMKITGLPSGTLYPTVARLERDGWLASELEKIDPTVEERPPRRYYTLNPAMTQRARNEVTDLADRLALAGDGGRRPLRRPGFAGGAV